MADIKYVSELNFKRGLKGVVDWIKEKFVKGEFIESSGGGYARGFKFVNDSGYSALLEYSDTDQKVHFTLGNETASDFTLAQEKELTTWSYSGEGETGSYIKLFGPEDSAASPILNFTKTDDGIYFSGNRDNGLAVGITGVYLASTDYVTVRSIKVNGTALTPDSNKAVDVAVPITEIQVSGGVVSTAHISNGANNEHINITPTANGYSIALTKEASPDNISVTKALPDETRVNALITEGLGSISGVQFQVVQTLPATGVNGVFYLIANPTASGSNIYDEYVWVNKGTPETPDYAFERLGTMDVDLTDYTKETDFVALTNDEVDAVLVEIGVKTATPTP